MPSLNEHPRAAARRAELYDLLGELPPRNYPLSVHTTAVTEQEGYTQEWLLLDLNGQEPVPAFFIRPHNMAGRLPTVLYNHAHGGAYHLGKNELTMGREDLVPYATSLTARGFNVLCIDTWCFGERQSLTEQERFKLMLWHGQVLWGMMVYDSIRAVDYLCSRDDVDAERLGAIGASMGSTMSWWLAALDTRIKVCAETCCLTDYQALIEAQALNGHGIYYYVPRLLKHFTAGQINALIAPRRHLSLVGKYDTLTPPRGVDRIDEEVSRVYAELGCPEHWDLRRFEVGHALTAEMKRQVLDYLQAHL